MVKLKRPSVSELTISTVSASHGRTARQMITMTPPHPGETIKEEYLVPLGMSVNALAKELGIGAARLNEIVRARRGITADTALRLAR